MEKENGRMLSLEELENNIAVHSDLFRVPENKSILVCKQIHHSGTIQELEAGWK